MHQDQATRQLIRQVTAALHIDAATAAAAAAAAIVSCFDTIAAVAAAATMNLATAVPVRKRAM